MAVTNTGIVERVITGVHDANFVRPLGDEEVSNGGFDTDTDWTKGTGWSISGGVASCDGTQISNSNLYQVVYTSGKTFKTTISVTSINGTLNVFTGSGAQTMVITSVGDYQVFYESTTMTMYIQATASTDVTIDNISVKEALVTRESTATNTGVVERSITGVHDANFVRPLGDEEVSNGDFSTDSWWTLGQFWSIANGFVTRAVVGSELNYSVSRSNLLTIGKSYKVEIDVNSVDSGSVKVVLGSTNSTEYTSDGVYIFEGVCTSSTNFKISPSNDFNGSIDNVSIKEMLVSRESTATNTGIVERGVTGLNESVAFRQDTRTNLIPYSEEFSNAYWTKTGASVVSGFSSPSADTPLGAFKVVNSVGSSIHNIKIPTIAVQSGLTYTYSIFLKKGTKDIITIEDGNQVFGLASFNLTLKTSTNLNGINSKIEEFTNGWFKCSVSRLSASTGLKFTVYSGVSASGGDESGDFYIFGSQLEQKSYATSYIPTSGAAVTVDNNSTSVVNNTGIVERPIVGVNESDEMFPDNGTSSVVNIAEVIIPLLDSLEARATTFENREATQEILINLQKC